MRFLHDMTWSEIRNCANRGAVLVLPTGSTEQHGPHLPTQTDSLLVESVTRAALEHLQQTSDDNESEHEHEGEHEHGHGHRFICAPTLWLGASDHHRTFFALSVEETTYVSVLSEICASVAEAGFKKLYIVNGHGGNTAPLRVAIAKIRKSAPELLIATADYWALAAEQLRKERVSSPGGAAHAGEIETSLMMHLAPQSVKTDRLEPSVPNVPEGYEIDLIDGGSTAIYAPWDELSKKGHLGDPTVSDEDHGKRFFDASVSAVAQSLHRFQEFSL